jgi:hypothetical protein
MFSKTSDRINRSCAGMTAMSSTEPLLLLNPASAFLGSAAGA